MTTVLYISENWFVFLNVAVQMSSKCHLLTSFFHRHGRLQAVVRSNASNISMEVQLFLGKLRHQGSDVPEKSSGTVDASSSFCIHIEPYLVLYKKSKSENIEGLYRVFVIL